MNITSVGRCPTLEELARHMFEKTPICLSVQLFKFTVTITSIQRESEESNYFIFRGRCSDQKTPDLPVQSIVGWMTPGSHLCNIQIKHIDTPASRKSA